MKQAAVRKVTYYVRQTMVKCDPCTEYYGIDQPDVDEPGQI
jgi:hypothetical protein